MHSALDGYLSPTRARPRLELITTQWEEFFNHLTLKKSTRGFFVFTLFEQ